MIMTVVIEDGALAAAAAGDVRASEISKQSRQPGQFWSGLVAGPGQTIHVVNVPDKLGNAFADPSGLMGELATLLKQRGML